MASSSSSSPCAACKIQRRKCTQECVFAPYFPPDQPQKFCNVHKVFGASNVSKLLQELSASQREDAVNSLAYEAEARLRDPVYGCVGLISVLQHKLRQVQNDLNNAKKELASYIGPHAAASLNLSLFQPPPPPPLPPYNNLHQHHQPPFFPQPLMAIPKGASSSSSLPPAGHEIVLNIDPHQQQQQQHFFEAQQLAAAMAAREQQELLRISLEQKLNQPQEFLASSSHGFNNQNMSGPSSNTISPTLALGSSFDNSNYHVNQPQQSEHHNLHHHQLLREQLMLGQAPQPEVAQQVLHQQQTQIMLQKLESEESKSVGPSC
ncbi:hypothetical protein L484_013233 [Morus notabilis]|uniref:LOB domain-containing protein n=2 Tax=Morus notabilis TaxID=981085 RepID=W9SE87_9ROSA|nr:hypothetical protein L484_013233 [Morus notabilis]